MESMHATRTAENRVCTCWADHRLILSEQAFKHIDDPGVKNALKHWIDDGNSTLSAGDLLYDVLWMAEKRAETGLAHGMNTYFSYTKCIDNSIWLNVVLLRKIGKCKPYTTFDKVTLDPYAFELSFVNLNDPKPLRAQLSIQSY